MEKHILEVIGTKDGYVKSANGVSLGSKGGNTSFFSGEIYPLTKDYFKYLNREGWELVSQSAYGHSGNILYIFEGSYTSYMTKLDGSRYPFGLSYKVKWEGGRWEELHREFEEAEQQILDSMIKRRSDNIHTDKNENADNIFSGRYYVDSKGQEHPLTRMEVIQEYIMRFFVIGVIIFVVVLAILFFSGAP